MLYEAFRLEEAKRITDRLELHHAPKHGSWLDIAEIELSALTRLPRIAVSRPGNLDQQTLIKQVAAGEQERNAAEATVHRQFTAAEARVAPLPCTPSLTGTMGSAIISCNALDQYLEFGIDPEQREGGVHGIPHIHP